MDRDQRTATAIVKVTLLVPTGTWGPDCTLAQATRQAEADALQKVQQRFQRDPVRVHAIDHVAVTFTEHTRMGEVAKATHDPEQQQQPDPWHDIVHGLCQLLSEAEPIKLAGKVADLFTVLEASQAEARQLRGDLQAIRDERIHARAELAEGMELDTSLGLPALVTAARNWIEAGRDVVKEFNPAMKVTPHAHMLVHTVKILQRELHQAQSDRQREYDHRCLLAGEAETHQKWRDRIAEAIDDSSDEPDYDSFPSRISQIIENIGASMAAVGIGQQKVIDEVALAAGLTKLSGRSYTLVDIYDRIRTLKTDVQRDERSAHGRTMRAIATALCIPTNANFSTEAIITGIEALVSEFNALTLNTSRLSTELGLGPQYRHQDVLEAVRNMIDAPALRAAVGRGLGISTWSDEADFIRRVNEYGKQAHAAAAGELLFRQTFLGLLPPNETMSNVGLIELVQARLQDGREAEAVSGRIEAERIKMRDSLGLIDEALVAYRLRENTPISHNVSIVCEGHQKLAAIVGDMVGLDSPRLGLPYELQPILERGENVLKRWRRIVAAYETEKASFVNFEVPSELALGKAVFEIFARPDGE